MATGKQANLWLMQLMQLQSAGGYRLVVDAQVLILPSIAATCTDVSRSHARYWRIMQARPATLVAWEMLWQA